MTASITTSPLVEWFERERGIREETLQAFGARFEGDDTVQLPYSNGEKTRKFYPDGKRGFFFTAGRTPSIYLNPNDLGDCNPATFLVEGETDTMRLWQELNDSGAIASVRGLSGSNGWHPGLVDEFRNAQRVFVILDNEDEYDNPVAAKQVDDCWKAIRKDLGSKARRVRLPHGIKDICEFFQGHDLETLRMLTEMPRVTASRYKPLDLMSEPPPIDWLLEGFTALGDVTLQMGDAGLGKSWWTMGLCLAVAQGWDEFLGLPVLQHGRVLYVDEENPQDVVYSRLNRLGLTPAGAANIRYLNNQGIRLDRKGDEFLEEALDYNPTLIVLDSLTRIHTEDENSSGAMSKLYNDGIKPLARETGAAVVLIHHAKKGGGNSYDRSRGSSDITASVDAGIDFRPAEPDQQGFFHAKLFRSRRRKGGDELLVEIRDNEDGSAALIPNAVPEPPF